MVRGIKALDALDGKAYGVPTIVVGTEAANVINVAIQMKNLDEQDMAAACAVPFYLADDVVGLDPATAAPDGGIVIGTDGAMIEWTGNLSGLLVSEADGDIDIDMTDAGVMTKYLVLVMPDGSLVVSAAITWA